MIDRLRALYRQYNEAIRYIFFGGLTTLVNYAVYFLCRAVLPVETVTIPNAIAWVVSVLFAYGTNRRWVFFSEVRGFLPRCREMASFFGSRLFSGVLDMAVMWLTVDLLHWNDVVMKLLSNIILVIAANYLLSKFWIFRKKTPPEAKE